MGGTSQVSSTTNLTSVNLSMGYYNLKLPDDYTVRVHLIFWINKENNMLSYETEKAVPKIIS